MKVQSSHCEQLCFLLTGSLQQMAWRPPSHPRSNSNIQLSSLWSARKLSMHSLIRIHHWVKAAFRGINSTALQTERAPRQVLARRLCCWHVLDWWVLRHLGQVLTPSVIQWIVPHWLLPPLWHSAVHLLMPSFTVLDTDLLLLHSEEIFSNGLSVLNGTFYWF